MRENRINIKNRHRSLLTALLAVLAVCLLTGCGKENKYVNMGVQMSTDGISLCLIGYTESRQSVSNYVFFSGSPEETISKITRDAQNIDIAYLPAEGLSMITPDMDLSVVFIDCLNPDGTLKGVWIARNEWIASAPNYSQKFIDNLVKCAEYRDSHYSMSYAEAVKSIEGVRDVELDKYDDVMQFCAAYAANNKETLEDNDYQTFSAIELNDMLDGFSSGRGEAYELCREAYDTWCSGKNVKAFDELFDMSLMELAVGTYLLTAK